MLALTLFYWRHFSFSGILPGDAADARYTTSLYEHWYLYFTGKVSLTENFFFYPTQNTLSFSDAYLIQGIFHSIFRLIDVSILSAWLMSTVAVHLLGVFSSYLIGKTLHFTFTARLVLICYWGFNSVIWVQRGHVQNLGYALIGYPILFSILWQRNKERNLGKLYFALAGISAILIGLSSAYALVFLVLIGGLIAIFFHLSLLRNLHNQRKFPWNIILKQYILEKLGFFKSGLKSYLLPLVSLVPFVILFLYCYVFSVDRITTRSPAEAAYYSPTFSEIAEVPPDNYVFGRIITRLFAYSFPAFGERYMGFTPTFLFLFAVSGIVITLFSSQKKRLAFLSILFFTIVFQEILVLRDGRGFNIWYLTGARLPFFDAIRGMSRIHQVQYMFGGLLISATISYFQNYFTTVPSRINSLIRRRNAMNGLGFLIAICLSLGEANSYYGSWNKSEMKPLSVVNQSKLSSCSSFILVPAQTQFDSRPWYLWLIDAQIYATEIQVPTVSGYSGGSPSNYGLDYSSYDALNKSIAASPYLKTIAKLCKLTPSTSKIGKNVWEVSVWE
jgi:hypothetical protein